MKKTTLVATAITITVLTNVAILVPSAEAAHVSTGRRIERQIKRTFKNKVESHVNQSVRKAINRIFRLTDPNTREAMELNASYYLRSIPPGETVIFTGNSRMLNIVRAQVKNHPSQLYACEQVRTKSGKLINALYVTRFYDIDDRIQRG